MDASRVYAPCDGNRVCAYAAADGHRLWSVADSGGSGSAIVGGSVLYLADGITLNAATGARVKTFAFGPSAVGDGNSFSRLQPPDGKLYGR